MPETKTQIVLNSQLSQKWRTETLNNRLHIVVPMLPVRGNSVMNRMFYPDRAINESYTDLNNKIALAGHPKVDGVDVDPDNPLAINAQNIGAFVRNVSKVGLDVKAELWVDQLIAEATDTGEEVVERIKNSGNLGISTGGAALFNGEPGEIAGQPFDDTVSAVQWDHVAILLNEKPAGGASTRVLNETSVNDLQRKLELLAEARFPGKSIWIQEIYLDSMRVIVDVSSRGMGVNPTKLYRIPFSKTGDEYSLLPDQEEVKKITSYIKKVTNVKKEEAVMADVTQEQVDDFLKEKKQRVVNSDQLKELEGFNSEKAEFDAWKTGKSEKLAVKRAELVRNSELTAEDVESMPESVIDKLIKTPVKVNNSLRGGGGVSDPENLDEEEVTERDVDDIFSDKEGK